MDNNYNSSNYSSNNSYYESQHNSPQYSQPIHSDLEEPVSVGDWLVTYLILLIPCVNIIMMFVFAFGNFKKSKSNFFKAQLIMTGIMIALYLLFIAFIFIVGVSSTPTYY